MLTFTSATESDLPPAAIVKSAGTPGAAMLRPWPSSCQASAPAGSATRVAGDRRLETVTDAEVGRPGAVPVGRVSLLATPGAPLPAAEGAAVRVGDLRSFRAFPGELSFTSEGLNLEGGAGMPDFGRAGCMVFV